METRFHERLAPKRTQTFLENNLIRKTLSVKIHPSIKRSQTLRKKRDSCIDERLRSESAACQAISGQATPPVPVSTIPDCPTTGTNKNPSRGALRNLIMSLPCFMLVLLFTLFKNKEQLLSCIYCEIFLFRFYLLREIKIRSYKSKGIIFSLSLVTLRKKT